MAKAKLGSGARFKKLTKKLSGKAKSPKAMAPTGRKRASKKK